MDLAKRSADPPDAVAPPGDPVAEVLPRTLDADTPHEHQFAAWYTARFAALVKDAARHVGIDKQEAKDIVQAILLRYWKRWHVDSDEQRGLPQLRYAVKREVRKHVLRAARHVSLDAEQLEEQGRLPVVVPRDWKAEPERFQIVDDALAILTPAERTTYEMRYGLSMPYEDIAAELRVKRSTVHDALKRANRKLCEFAVRSGYRLPSGAPAPKRITAPQENPND